VDLLGGLGECFRMAPRLGGILSSGCTPRMIVINPDKKGRGFRSDLLGGLGGRFRRGALHFGGRGGWGGHCAVAHLFSV
jgi:hypothetical protein